MKLDKYVYAHMGVAEMYAQLSSCERRKVGCLIVKNGTPIAIGYNGTPPGDDNCCEDCEGKTKANVIHAEDNALRKLTRSNENAKDADVYITTAPCRRCAERLVDAQVKNVWYRDSYSVDDGEQYLLQNGINIRQLLLN